MFRGVLHAEVAGNRSDLVAFPALGTTQGRCAARERLADCVCGTAKVGGVAGWTGDLIGGAAVEAGEDLVCGHGGRCSCE